MDGKNDDQIWSPQPNPIVRGGNKTFPLKHQSAGLSFLLGLVFYAAFWFVMWFWDEVYGTSVLTVNQWVWFAWFAVFVPYPLLLMHKILLAKPWKDYCYCFLGFAFGTFGAVLLYFRLSQGGVL